MCASTLGANDDSRNTSLKLVNAPSRGKYPLTCTSFRSASTTASRVSTTTPVPIITSLVYHACNLVLQQSQLHLSSPFVAPATDTTVQETRPGRSVGGVQGHPTPVRQQLSATDKTNQVQQIKADYLPFPKLSPVEQSPCTAGRIAKHLENWKEITQDP